ncbi:MAG: cytidylate kinase-like family protein, partial [Chloroflexota bacterium]|nr:cytidylate kinase-like family protein [Chloroflexota bacterium]
MQAQQRTSADIRAITISREYGSGGGEIATRLARRLNWQLIDHEVVVRVARDLGVTEAEAEAHDEYTQSLLERILTSMQGVDPVMLSVAPIPLYVTSEQSYHEALSRVVEAAVARGHAVIVGRGGQMLLQGHRDVFHLRVVAPLEARIAYVIRREGLSREDAQARVQLKDRDRVRYLQAEYHRSPEDAHLYDLIVNTGILDLDSAIDLVTLALERKARQLDLPLEALGPGAGVSRYPQQPGDFRPPEHLSGPA